MTPEQERQFEKKAEQHFKGQRELPNGRDFRWNSQRDFEAEKRYRQNFDAVFPNSPGFGF